MKGSWIRRGDGDCAVVFLHGVLSDGDGCWRHTNGTYWPTLLSDAESLGSLGIYVFTYKTGFFSGTYRLGNVVDDLKEHLRLDRVFRRQGSIIFVCHSMGGIVARKFVVQQAAELIEMNVEAGLFLIASPSLGSEYATWLTPIARFFKHSQAEALRFSQTNAWLLDLDGEFQNLKESRRLALTGKELVEDNFILLPGVVRNQVVPPFSGAKYFGHAYKVPNSDHFSICKVSSAEDIQHRLLVQYISEFLSARRTREASSLAHAKNQPTENGPVSGLHLKASVQVRAIVRKASRATEDAIASSSAKKEVKQVLRDLHTGIKHAALRSSLDGAELLLQTFASYVQEAIKERPSSFKFDALAKRLIDTLADYGREIATPIVALLIQGIQEFDDIEFEP
jgi:pimeloyl-ACP methyl ester carboxylesterase